LREWCSSALSRWVTGLFSWRGLSGSVTIPRASLQLLGRAGAAVAAREPRGEGVADADVVELGAGDFDEGMAETAAAAAKAFVSLPKDDMLKLESLTIPYDKTGGCLHAPAP